MKRIFLNITLLTLLAFSGHAQIFWTENFTGGGTGTTVSGFTSPNGTWANTVLGAEGAYPNIWYVSCTEGGKLVGVCGSVCATGDLGSTLHLGSNTFVGGDLGAAYFAGGCTSYTSTYGYTYTTGICAATDRRAESPVINCTTKAGISLSYYYIENGQASSDNGTVWYFNGTTWSLLEDPPKTTVCGTSQGQWAKRTVALPSSADHNPNVKIGFRWVNDEDGIGTDPSFAIDSVSLRATPPAPVASFSMTADSVCQDSCITFTSTSTMTGGTIDSFRWSIVGTPYSLPNVSPLPLCMTATVVPTGTYTMRLDVYSGAGHDTETHTFRVKPIPAPPITKAGHVLSVPTGYVSYQWYNGTAAITGATNATYTYTVSGVYKVVVDSGGCKGSSAVKNTTGVGQVDLCDGKFWVTQKGNNMLALNYDQLLTEDVNIVVSDQAGRQIISALWVAGTDEKEVRCGDIAPGLYIVRLSNTKSSAVLKWIKQ